MAAIKVLSPDEWVTLSSHGPRSSEPNSLLPAHFTSHFRLLDLSQKILGQVLSLAMPSYPVSTPPVAAIIQGPRKCRQNLANHPPPTVLMRTCNKIGALARAIWLEDLFHLYIASWSKLDENKALLTQVAGMTDMCVTLDIRAGTPSRIESGQEDKLRASAFGRQIRALVVAMQPADGMRVRRLLLKVYVGMYATTYVVRVIMEAWRQLRVEVGVKMEFGINYEERNRNPYGEARPGIPGPKFTRQLVADMVGRDVATIGPCRVVKRRRDKKTFELYASSANARETPHESVRINVVGGPEDAEKEGAEEQKLQNEAGAEEVG